MISAIVLAAGKTEQACQPKLLLPLRGKPVLQWVLESVLGTKVGEVICVAGDFSPVNACVSIKDERVFWLMNDRAGEGRSSSMIAGLWGVHASSEGALFLPGDQPSLGSDLLSALIARFETVAASIIAPIFQGTIRNPVLFRRELFPELLGLTDDHGGRAMAEMHRDRVELVQWNDESPFMGVDEQKDCERVKLPA